MESSLTSIYYYRVSPPAGPDAGAEGRCSIEGQVSQDWQAALFGPEGLRLNQWRREGQARLVKHGPRRAVYQVDAAGQSFYVKHYRCRGRWQAIGRWFQSSPARREFLRGREALRRRIPTAEPVAWLECGRAGAVYDSFLVTRAIADACSLQECLETILPALTPPATARWRRQLTLGLARLCAAAHRGGLDHDDLHPGNVLVRFDDGRKALGHDRLPDLFLIDLPGARLARPLGRRRVVANLTMLAASCSAWAATTDMWRFWRAYLQERPDLDGRDSRAMARMVAGAIPGRRRRVARGRDKRALRSNREFHRRQNGPCRAMAVSDLSRQRLALLLEDPSQPLRANVHRPYKLSHRSVVVRADLALDGGATPIAYKRVRPRCWWKTLFHYFRRNPAVEAWYYGHALLSRGIATARPLAVVQRRRFGLPAEGFLGTQWVDGANNLHVYAWGLAERPAEERRRRARQVARALGRLLGRMHSWHVSHRDLKGCNILIVERPDSIECCLIDADSVRLPRRLPVLFRAFNLGRLATSLEAHAWVTRADRLRFFRAYLSELHRRDPSAWPADWKQGWRAVARATRRIVGRLQRGGREIA